MVDIKADLYLDKLGIFHWDFHPKANIDLINAQAGYNFVEKILNGRKVPVLVDMRAAMKINKLSRDFYKDHATNYFLAGAMIIGSPISKIIANFFIGLNKPPMPMKIVTSENEGMNWLMNFIKNSVEP